MSRARGGARRAADAALLVAVALVGGACWEQVSPEWFAQMKRQPAVQPLAGPAAPHVPPEGTVPFGGIEPRIDHPAPAFAPEAALLRNPLAASPASLARGEEVYGVYCAVCHGPDGMARLDQQPVALRMAQSGMPPVALMAVPAYSDGFLFTKIRYGKPGMPGYPQITPEDRWHVVNYLRKLIPGAATP